MPETPDFESIADGMVLIAESDIMVRRRIAEQLRLMWNARGAADISQLESTLSGLMGVTAAGPYVKNLDRALRTLDR